MLLSPLQIREVFHLHFLQEFLRKFDPKLVILKGGVNLRFFFKSPRYSEDMDLDVKTASIASVQKNTLRTLEAISTPMKVYGIAQIIPPAMKSAKQTETTQRFKIHLHTTSGLDLFTKVEFSRRGFKSGFKFEKVEDSLLRTYRMSPVVVQHYLPEMALEQKILALAGRREVQARDVFDIYQLGSFLSDGVSPPIRRKILKTAIQRVREIFYEEYREAVVAYLSEADQKLFSLQEVWKQIQTSVIERLEPRSAGNSLPHAPKGASPY